MLKITNNMIRFLNDKSNELVIGQNCTKETIFGFTDLIIEKFQANSPYTIDEVRSLKVALMNFYITLCNRGQLTKAELNFLDIDLTGKFKSLDYMDTRNDDILKAIYWIYNNKDNAEDMLLFKKNNISADSVYGAIKFIKTVYEIINSDEFRFNLMAEIKRDYSGKHLGYGNIYKGSEDDMYTLLKIAKLLGYIPDGSEQIFFKRCLIMDGVCEADPNYYGDIRLTSDELEHLADITNEFGGD